MQRPSDKSKIQESLPNVYAILRCFMAVVVSSAFWKSQVLPNTSKEDQRKSLRPTGSLGAFGLDTPKDSNKSLQGPPTSRVKDKDCQGIEQVKTDQVEADQTIRVHLTSAQGPTQLRGQAAMLFILRDTCSDSIAKLSRAS